MADALTPYVDYTDVNYERVKALRQGMLAVVTDAIHCGDVKREAEVFYALSQLLAGLIVRVAHGDLEESERLFLIVCEHTMVLIPEFEAIRAAKEGPPPQSAPSTDTVN